MRIRRKFLQLTRYTYPYGTEDMLKSYLPEGYKTDEWGNFYYMIGSPTTMFACHLDTVNLHQNRVIHVQDSRYIRTDGSTILGADDKAGMVVMLNMIENGVTGLYYFFIGEEVGCIGSRCLAKYWEKVDFCKPITKVISFDRRDTDSIITHQFFGRCCSMEFALELASRLNGAGENLKLEPDPTGASTDSAQFIDLVPECTNISVGYYNEHTVKEYQDIEYLQRLCNAVCKIDWETLPIERNMLEYDYYDDFCEPVEEFSSEYFSNFSVNGKVKRMYVSLAKIKEERALLYNWVFTQGYPDITGIIWNGHSLYVETERGTKDFIGTRNELMGVVPQVGSVSIRHLCDNPYGVYRSNSLYVR